MIGVFDSGIGGVTVLKELLKLLPNEKYIYYSDSINNPYGDKTNEEIIDISDKVVEFLINKGCTIIVIACNTASAIAKDYLRNKYSIPIIAIEPAYKSVLDDEKTLVMATKATINSDKFKTLFNKYDNHNTILLSCSGLADLIEEGNKDKIIEYLNNKIGEYKGVKNVVLGCTHYPLIKEEISKVLGPVNFYDGSLGVAKHTKEVMEEKGLITNSKQEITFIDSSNNKEDLFYELLKR
ncbi:MAG: glutamate racemase [Bacilli bacterium]|nr:glutamate racemase [Bacilli bacterium]